MLGILAVLCRPPVERLAAESRVQRSGALVTLGNGHVTVRYDLDRGLAGYRWGERTVVRDGYSSATLAGEALVQVYSFQGRDRRVDHAPFADAGGSGVSLLVTTTFPEIDAALLQQIVVYDAQPVVMQRVSVRRLTTAGPPLSVQQIEVLAAGPVTGTSSAVSIEPATDPRFLRVPFFNLDDYSLLPARSARGALGYWLGGLLDAAEGHGLVAGAVETEQWKSAVWFDGPTGSLSLHSGVQSPVDAAFPAPIAGRQVDSALMAVSYRDDHQDALADLMQAVAQREPPLEEPPLPAPIGWSAWYAHGMHTDEQTVRGVTDFIAEQWSSLGYRYINLDAGWNRADGDTRYDPAKFPGGIEPLVDYIHGRGLLAGAYFIPFAISPSLLDRPVPGSNERFRDLILRDAAGTPVRAHILDWEYVLDVTHPAAEAFLYLSARQIAGYGFDFVKLDFLQIGTQEGARFDPTVTSMEAFHRGMQAISAAWRDSGRPIFVSAAISPLYVQRYAHARRSGTDVDQGQAREAANVALSWFTALLYHRNDPDNAVVRANWFSGYNDRLAKLHTTVTALGGTLFLAGDDPRTLSPERAALLTNEDVVALAQEPLVIRPLSLDETPAPVWHAALSDGSHIVALFNWDGAHGIRRTVRFADLGLSARPAYVLTDIWAQIDVGAYEASFTVELPPHGVTLLRVQRR